MVEHAMPSFKNYNGIIWGLEEDVKIWPYQNDILNSIISKDPDEDLGRIVNLETGKGKTHIAAFYTAYLY